MNVLETISSILHNKNTRFIAQCILLYGACYLLYYCTSVGQDAKDMGLASRQLIPPMLIFYVVQRVSGKTLLSWLWLTQFLTGMSWAMTTPILMYLQAGSTATSLSPMADILFGCYAALFLMSAQQLTAGRKHCRLFQSCTTILSMLLMFIPLCQVLHFLLYGQCITEMTILLFRTQAFLPHLMSTIQDIGIVPLLIVAIIYYFIGYFIFKFNAKIFISLPTLKSHASVLIFFLTFVILAVYLPNTIIRQTYFFEAWHNVSIEEKLPDFQPPQGP